MIGQNKRRATSSKSLQPIRRFLAGWAVFLVTLVYSSAQPDDLYFHHLTPAQGLSQSTNRCIYRDSSGFVWIGSAEGLNRFDGVRVKVYKSNPDDPHQLADPTITSDIFEDRQGDLWFCTHTALHRYRRQYDDFERFILYDTGGTALKGYEAFHIDRHEQLWLYCNDQLYLFDVRDSLTPASRRFHPLSKLSGTRFRLFERDAENGEEVLYVVTSIGVERYTYGPKGLTSLDTLFAGKHGQPAASVWDLFQEKNGMLWVGCNESLYLVKSEAALLRIDRFAGQPIGTVRQIQPWGERYLFVATDRGLYLLDKIALQFIRHWQFDSRNSASLSTNNLSVLHLDGDQNLWISVWTKGVDFTNLRKLKFQIHRYYPKNKTGERNLFVPGPMLEDSRKRIWCGSQMNGLLALQADGIHYEDFSALAPAPDQLFNLASGNLLINNFGQGLIMLDPENKTSHTLYWKQKAVSRYHICQIATNVFLLSSGDGIPGLLKLTIKGYRYIFEPVKLDAVAKKNWFYGVRQSDHEFLIADENYSVFYFREEPNAILKQVVVLPGYINCSQEEDTSTWLAGSFGLCRIGKFDHQYHYITTRDGLPDNMVYAILRLGPDAWWLSTGKGLVRFNPLTMQFQKFGLADGLQAFEYNRRSCLRTSEGVLWFGGIGGYNRFNPDAIQPLSIQPIIQVVDIHINEGKYPYYNNPSQVTEIRLPYDSATLAFHFAALEYSDPLNNQLKYRLYFANGTPYDQDWVYCPDARGFARYANLPPNRYKLQIMAANSDGIWNPIPKDFFIEITPPYYQTWWFRGLLTLIGIIALYAAYRSRLIAMRKKEAHKRKIIELELNALRAQLNPHFISNNLISINSYIRNNGVEKVRGYVSTFARLMRNVLESARNPAVPLAEELQMLQNFVELESGRFPQSIDFTIDIESGLDSTQLFMPGMLLQPIIENAIVHGLAPSNGQGKITLQVFMESEALVFVIENDGIYRDRPLMPKPALERKSHGLDITRERLHLYDLQHTTKSYLTMEDIKTELGTSIGTRVILHLGLSKT